MARSGAERVRLDLHNSRYLCFSLLHNADSAMKVHELLRDLSLAHPNAKVRIVGAQNSYSILSIYSPAKDSRQRLEGSDVDIGAKIVYIDIEEKYFKTV